MFVSLLACADIGSNLRPMATLTSTSTSPTLAATHALLGLEAHTWNKLRMKYKHKITNKKRTYKRVNQRSVQKANKNKNASRTRLANGGKEEERGQHTKPQENKCRPSFLAIGFNNHITSTYEKIDTKNSKSKRNRNYGCKEYRQEGRTM